MVTWAERPDLAERGPASAAIRPEYNLHGDAFEDWWKPLLEELPEYQFALHDDAADIVLAEAHTGPLAWDDDDRALPDGIDAALGLSHAATAPATRPTRSARSPPRSMRVRASGAGRRVAGRHAELARRRRLRRMIAPVRPSWKERYPLAPIERYITWRRADGQLLDPWMRLHERLGARARRVVGRVRRRSRPRS